MQHADKCHHCGASIRYYQHALNKPMLLALYRLQQWGGEANITKIGLSHAQICNFAKLKYWELVTPRHDGVWAITHRGMMFLAGREAVPRRVVTFRGSRVKYEGELVGITEYLPVEYQRRAEYAARDIDTNGILFEGV